VHLIKIENNSLNFSYITLFNQFNYSILAT
jgi:hypothetical protein